MGQQTTSLLHFLPCGKLCSWGPSPSNTSGFPSTCGVCLLHASCCSPLLLVFFGVAQVKCEMEATKLALSWCLCDVCRHVKRCACLAQRSEAPPPPIILCLVILRKDLLPNQELADFFFFFFLSMLAASKPRHPPVSASFSSAAADTQGTTHRFHASAGT